MDIPFMVFSSRLTGGCKQPCRHPPDFSMRTLLQSSSLAAADYDEETQELTITFQNGSSYDYSGVPPEIYKGLVEADSPGRYFHAVIKTGYG